MASKTQERLLEEFGGLFDGETTELHSLVSGDGDLTQSLTGTVKELGQMAAGMTTNSPGSVAATPAGTNTRGGSSNAPNSNDGEASVGSIATTFLEGGLGVVPLVRGLVGLFTGGSDAPPPWKSTPCRQRFRLRAQKPAAESPPRISTR